MQTQGQRNTNLLDLPFSQAADNLPTCLYGQLNCAALCTDFLNFSLFM